MYKVLQVVASYAPAYVYGGPIISVVNLCSGLVNAGFDLTVFTTTANGESDFDFENGNIVFRDKVKVVYFKRMTKDHSQFSPQLLYNLWKHIDEYNIVHIQAWWNLVSVGAALVCILKGKSFIVSPRGTLSQYSFNNKTSLPKKWFHQILGKQLLKSGHFLVSSEKEKQDLIKLGLCNYAKETAIIANIVKLPAVLPIKKKVLGEKIELLFFSRIEEKKGLEILLQAVSLLKIPYHLAIYGSGKVEYVKAIQEQVATSGSSDQILFLGAVYGDSKYDIFADYDLLILPSYDENFANVVLETLSVGTAALLTKHVGLSDYVVNKEFGWICDNSAKSVSEKIEEIYNKKEALNYIREVAPATIRNDFNSESLVKEHISFYAKILNK